MRWAIFRYEYIVSLKTTVKDQEKTIDTLDKDIQTLEDRITHMENKLFCYIDNRDGTITDNRTGLIWLKNANCFGKRTWRTAMRSVEKLAHGQCALSDGSQASEWRLPTKAEWMAMTEKGYKNFALSNAAGTYQWREGNAFSKVPSSRYWSSSTRLNFGSHAWYVNLHDGHVNFNSKNSTNYVWAVRGGE